MRKPILILLVAANVDDDQWRAEAAKSVDLVTRPPAEELTCHAATPAMTISTAAANPASA